MSSFLYMLPKESILKIMKNAFYFLYKALFILEIFNVLLFFSFFIPHFPDSKGHTKKGIFVNTFCNSGSLVTTTMNKIFEENSSFHVK